MYLQRAKLTNATDASFPTRVPTVVTPSGDGVHFLKPENMDGPAMLFVIPFGTGDENDVFEMRILLWCQAIIGASRLWVPFNVAGAAFVCTLSTQHGVSGQALDENDLVCDTITNADTDITSQSTFVSVVSPGNQLAGYITAGTIGAEYIEFIFAKSTGSPTGMNALWFGV